MKNKTKEIRNNLMKIGAAMLALTVAAGASTPAITSFTQAQPVTKTKKKAKAKKKTKAVKTFKPYMRKKTVSVTGTSLDNICPEIQFVTPKSDKSKIKWTFSNPSYASIGYGTNGFNKGYYIAYQGNKKITNLFVKFNKKKYGNYTFRPFTVTATYKGKKYRCNVNPKPNKACATAKNILAKYTNSSMTDVQKVAHITQWFAENTVYDINASSIDIGELDAIFVNHAGVCGDYAVAVQYIMKMAGIKCRIVENKFAADHEWNQVKIDDQWYNLDLSFCDKGEVSTTINERTLLNSDYISPMMQDEIKNNYKGIIFIPSTDKAMATSRKYDDVPLKELL